MIAKLFFFFLGNAFAQFNNIAGYMYVTVYYNHQTFVLTLYLWFAEFKKKR